MKQVVTIIVLMCMFLPASPAHAAPKAKLWKRWLTHNVSSTIMVDHSSWDALIKRHVTSSSDGVNRFSYGRVTDEDREAFAEYLAMLSKVRVSHLNRDEQRAYWINLYNALTVKVILNYYPVKSIKNIDISPGLFADGPWGKKLFTVEDEKVTLDEIEHRILRPIWKDPRIHYAVNCASIGCPNLQTDAFTAENTEALLEKAAREYVNHPRGASVNDGRLTVSSIYEWFKADFEGNDSGVIEHLRRYAEPTLSDSLKNIRRISYDYYDWSLNDAQ